MASTEKLARRLDGLEKEIRSVATQPRLRHSSLDGGSLELKDRSGNLAGVIGEQYDGTVTSAAMGGSWPSRPAGVLLEPTIGGLKMYWDGTYDDGSVARMDFKRVTFHAVTNLEDLDILNPAQMVGEITTAAGGETACWLPPVEHFVVAVAWTEAGKFSEESDPSFATPIQGSTHDEWQAHETAMEELRGSIAEGATDIAGISELVALINRTASVRHEIY